MGGRHRHLPATRCQVAWGTQCRRRARREGPEGNGRLRREATRRHRTSRGAGQHHAPSRQREAARGQPCRLRLPTSANPLLGTGSSARPSAAASTASVLARDGSSRWDSSPAENPMSPYAFAACQVGERRVGSEDSCLGEGYAELVLPSLDARGVESWSYFPREVEAGQLLAQHAGELALYGRVVPEERDVRRHPDTGDDEQCDQRDARPLPISGRLDTDNHGDERSRV